MNKNYQHLLVVVFCYLSSYNFSIGLADTLFDKQFSERLKEAQAGNRRAQYKLGAAYLTGNQVKVDISRSIHWFTKAANQGYVKAMYKLGRVYYLNRAGKRNKKKAFRWFTKGATKKHAGSAYNLAKVYFDGLIIGRDNSRALHWARLAKQYGSFRAEKLINTIQTVDKFDKGDAVRGEIARVSRVKTAPKVKKKVVIKRSVRKRTVKRVVNSKKLKSRIRTATKSTLSRTKQYVFKGKWHIGDKVAEYLPSEFNKCIPSDKEIKCKSNTIVRTTDLYSAHIEFESVLSKFSTNGSFMVAYKINYLEVTLIDSAVDDDEDEIPKTGWQKTSSKLRCKLIQKKLIKCFTDDLRVERFYSK